MLPQMIASRYKVLSLLGEGGMGAVYRCLDTKNGAHVALKTLVYSGPNAERALWRFRREFAAMRRLDHPHCVRVFEFGQEQDTYFFTMEFVDGVAFNRLRGSPDVLPLSMQVLSALDYIHGQGIIHRDLKPHNVLISLRPSQRAVLADFGIAKVDDGENLTSAGGVLGTLAYLSPEQAEGKPVDPRADLYSFGVLLYESLLSHFPYALSRQATPVEYLRAHVIDAPISPRELWPQIPGGLEALLLRLLAKEPAQRPPSAAAVFESLRPFAGPHAVPELSSQGGSYLLPPRVVGRGREFAFLEEQLSTSSPQENLVFFSGDTGIGKSRLLEESVSLLRRHGFAVLRGQGEEGSPLPYSLWLAPLRQLLAEAEISVSMHATQVFSPEQAEKTEPNEGGFLGLSPEPGAGASMTPQERALLRRLLPELRDASLSSGEISLAPLENAAQERWSLLRGLAELLVNRALAGKLALVLDDLQDADEGSLEALLFLGRALARHPKRPVLLLLGAYRSDEVDAKHPLRATLSRLLTEGGAVEMPLSPLSLEDSAALLASSLGLAGDGVVRSLAERLHQGTLGNPFYLLELLKNLIADGRIQRVRGEWRLENAILGNASLLPENFREAMRRRLQKLPAAVRELLELFAVCGRTSSLDLLLSTSGLSEEDLLHQLDDAVRAKLIEETEAGASAFRFVNEPVRETLYDDLTPGRKRLLHAKVAARLLEQNGAHAELGRHFLRAGDKEKARRHLIKAGDQALRAYDGKMAVSFYEEAQALGQPEAILCEKLGRAHDLAGDLTAAEHLLSLAVDQSPEDSARVWRLRALAEVKRKRGAMGEAAEALEEAMRLLGRPLPKSRFGVLSSIVGQGLLRTAHNMGLSSKVKDSEREVEAQVTRLAASLTHVLYYVDYEKSVAAHLYMLNLAERLGPSEEQAMAYLYHAVALGTLGNFEETQSYLDKGRKMAEERKVKPLVERAGAYSAWLTWVQGNVSQAAELVDASLSQHRPSDPFDLATLLYVGSASCVAVGQLDAARAHVMALERLSQETNSRYTFGTARLHYGLLLLSEGKAATATPILEEARAAFLESGGRVYAIASTGFLGLSLARRGALDRAITVLEEASRDAERFHVKDPLVRVQAFLAESYLRRARQAGKNAKDAARDLASARAAAKLAQQAAKIFPIQTPLALRVAAEVEHDRGQEKAALALRQEAQAFEQAHGIRAERLEFSEGEG